MSPFKTANSGKQFYIKMPYEIKSKDGQLFKTEIPTWLSQDVYQYLLDFSETVKMSADFLTIITQFKRQVTEKGRSLSSIRVHKSLRQQINFAGLSTVFSIQNESTTIPTYTGENDQSTTDQSKSQTS